ncbi:diaminobutyrate acetyltransferase [Paenibacillus nasutitermitis]|uniref:L-2,4-diaminobutyric acid acetyltransferase n=1 Tax=Paenibacillus nasutitermitis TaxID=1652958 RepID=A0A917DZB7_9BACL|nr:diaminobutyrate acetyltransferase [Paenibacillus nasutitermitis]GGD81226.1 L-2,4-diaminobutyric acid acetyltransferase [Paenibacillus nasutitermitis]
MANHPTIDKPVLRKPSASDGTQVWELVKRVGTLDLNSVYSYIMLCDIFRDTCVIALQQDVIVGYMSAYRRPDLPDTLFVWQAAVDSSQRGKGLAKEMLRELLNREENNGIRFVEATIGPDNIASRRLFTGLGEERSAHCQLSEYYPVSYFPEGSGHEPELLLRVGPLTNKS